MAKVMTTWPSGFKKALGEGKEVFDRIYLTSHSLDKGCSQSATDPF